MAWLDDLEEQLAFFICEQCELMPGHVLRSKTFYEKYQNWCSHRQEKVIPVRVFHAILEDCFGYIRQRKGSLQPYYMGLRIKECA